MAREVVPQVSVEVVVVFGSLSWSLVGRVFVGLLLVADLMYVHFRVRVCVCTFVP